MEVMRLCLRERSGQPGCAELSALCGVIGDMTSLQHGSRIEDWLEFLILCYLLKDTEKLCQVTIQLSEAQGNDVMTKYAYDLNNRAVSDKQALISLSTGQIGACSETQRAEANARSAVLRSECLAGTSPAASLGGERAVVGSRAA
jgi:hypothetical protein